MLRKIELENWKSFEKSTLYVEPLTILIGTNASGKSNALDALEFLSRIASSTDFTAALAGDGAILGIRGELGWATYRSRPVFTLKVVVGTSDEKTDYEYSISISIEEGLAELHGEELTRIKYQGNNPRRLRLFWTDSPEEGSPAIVARLYNTKSGTKRPMRRSVSVLSQLELELELKAEILEGIRTVIQNLKGVFILDPNPSAMRDYCRLSENLKKDGSNLAGVLMAMPEDRRIEVERKISRLAAKIPEKDIERVWAEYIGRHQSDAMLYCAESWKSDDLFEIDARGMSDGTLRFIAVVGSLLIRPEGSTIVIEEIDNGLHPSRALLLLDAISEIAAERKIDLLITTHNVALLDALKPEQVRSVSIASRNSKEGASVITSLDDLPLLSRVMAEGEVGSLAKKGRIEESIREFSDNG